jgi:hypothetical protein
MTLKIINQSAERYPKFYRTKKFQSDLLKSTPKIRFSSSSWFGPILTLTFDLDPGYMV